MNVNEYWKKRSLKHLRIKKLYQVLDCIKNGEKWDKAVADINLNSGSALCFKAQYNE